MGLKVSEMWKSHYIGKDDLTRPIRARIEAAYWEEVNSERGKETKPVISFMDEGVKPLILNVTNSRAIADAFGDDSDGWHGKLIEMYHDPNVPFGPKITGGTRVRIPSAAAVAGPAQDANAMTSAEAFQFAGERDIPRGDVIAALKQAGLSKWSDNPGQATAVVQAMVAEAAVSEDPTDDIPF